MDKVIAVSVTYNCSDLLKRMADAVMNQSFPVDRLIIIDNNSNPTHAEKNILLKKEYSNVEIVNTGENLGGAGGFQYGIEYVLKKEYEFDWLWLMDDDAFPSENCLKHLLDYKDLKDAGCLAPVIFGVELQQYQLYHHKIIDKYLYKDRPAYLTFDDVKTVTSIDANSFVGPLFKHSVINEIGVPQGSLFIEGDDTEYTFRIRQKYNVFLIKDAVMNHRDIIKKDKTINIAALWKQYYMYRNRFLFIEEFKRGRLHGLIGKTMLTAKMIRHSVAVIAKKEDAYVKRTYISILRKAFADGICCRDGKRVDPVRYKQLLDNRVKYTKL